MNAHPEWNFREMSKAEVNIDPVHEEFFNVEALENLCAALVREDVQNTLDARRNGGPVRVRFVLRTGPQALPSNRSAKYLAALRPHLTRENLGVDEAPDITQPMPFLVIEDFGTHGLRGDPEQVDEKLSPGPKNDFFYFWRNLGRSKKADTDRGRWGLGKMVFPAASRIRAFLGLTTRSDDGRTLLMGHSVLKIHHIGHAKYCPYGYYGVFPQPSFAVPVNDGAFHEQFGQDFHLQRDHEPGLSIVIPYPDLSIDGAGIMRTVITHYFYPILEGALAVEVDSDGVPVMIDQKTIREVIMREFEQVHQRDNLLKLCDLAEWSLAVGEDQVTVLREQSVTRAPAWAPELLESSTAEALRAKYEAKERIAFRIPVKVHPKRGVPKTGIFHVYLHRDQQVDRGEVHFIRQGITIENPNVGREKGVRALVVIRNTELSTLLGDAENPAHTEWQDRSAKFKEKYEHGTTCLRFVKNSARELVRILTAASEEKDRDLLKDLFFVIKPADDQDLGIERGIGRKPRRKTKKAVELPAPEKIIRLERSAGGFRISQHPKAPNQNRRVDVRVAYALRSGNSIKHYVPEDFRLDGPPITVLTQSVNVVELADNHLVFETDGNGYEVTVTGFDTHRDLEVRLRHTEVQVSEAAL